LLDSAVSAPSSTLGNSRASAASTLSEIPADLDDGFAGRSSWAPASALRGLATSAHRCQGIMPVPDGLPELGQDQVLRFSGPPPPGLDLLAVVAGSTLVR